MPDEREHVFICATSKMLLLPVVIFHTEVKKLAGTEAKVAHAVDIVCVWNLSDVAKKPVQFVLRENCSPAVYSLFIHN